MSEPSPGWLDGREHVLPVRIYYEDTDFTGLVYHANYLRYLERGRSDFLRLLGVSHQGLAADDAALTVTRIEVDYRKGARVDDALEVRTLYESTKGPRLYIRQRVLRAGEVIAEAVVHAACIDMAGRARRPPPSLGAAIRPVLAP